MAFEHSLSRLAQRGIEILRLRGELEYEDRPALIELLRGLVGGGGNKLVVDLTQVDRLSSVFIGTFLDYAAKARETGKSLSLVMRGRMAGICRNAGLDRAAQIITAAG